MPFPRRSAARRGRRLALAALVLAPALALSLAACSNEANPLAPYLGQRPLEFLHVTQSFTPDIQWVGGRVAAVGVNRGDRAALDSTLVWIQRAPDNAISSSVNVGQDADRAYIESLGGTPQEELTDTETYTFWIAEASALGVGLDPARVTPGAFADTTVTFSLVLLGRGGGGAGAQFRVIRDERLIEGQRLIVSWTPEDLRFRQLAIRQATTGGWTDLIWHIRVPEGQPASISSPLVVGVPPEGTQEVIAFPETGFEPAAHILWAATDGWGEQFTLSAPGYAWFQMFVSNFQD